MAVRRAGLPLRENRLYEVLDCEQGDTSIVLTLSEFRVFHVAGVKHVVKLGSERFPCVSERFELM
jgi:hypothetical protein